MMPKAELPYRLSSSPGALRRFLPLLIYLGFAMAVGAVFWAVDFVPAGRLRESLKVLVPMVLKANLLLVVVGLALCAKDIAGAFSSLKNRRGLLLVAVVVFVFLLAAFVAPRTHRIYFDEDIYANVGQTIAEAGQAAFCHYGLFEYDEYKPIWTEYNKEPAGWPMLLSLVFSLFGTDEAFMFAANNAIFAGSVLVVFFIARLAGAGFFASLAGAGLFGLIPHNLTWANTGAVEPSAAFFAGAVVLCTLVFLQTGRGRHLFLLAVLIPPACQMRPESLLIFLWVVAALLTLRPEVFTRQGAWGWALVTTTFLLPLLLHLSAVSGESWGAEGAKFSLSYAKANLAVNGPYFFNGAEFPAAFTALALFGLFAGSPLRQTRALLLFWFFLFWAVFIPFYAGSYNYGADERFALLTFMPLSVLAGLGAGRLRDWLSGRAGRRNAAILVAAAAVFFAIQHLPQVRKVGQEAWGSRHDHLYAERFAEQIPRRSVVLTQNPTMFLLWGRGAIQTYAGTLMTGTVEDLLRRFSGNVYFHYNYWCNTPTVRNQRLCSEIMNLWDMQLVDRAQEQDFVYALYRLKGLKTSGGR